MTDLGPTRKRIAQLFRMLGSSGGERRNAFTALERVMQGDGITWTDIGDMIECGYSEDDLQQFGQVRHAEGVEAGIKIGEARKGNGGGNGHIALPKPSEMAEFCHRRLARMKDDAQRDFIRETYEKMHCGISLHPGSLGYLVSLYMKHGGKFQY